MSTESDYVLNNFVTFNVVKLANKFALHGKAFLAKEANMTMREWRLLVLLESLIEPTGPELAKAMAISWDELPEIAKPLMDRELVIEGPDEDDVMRYRLTEAGDAFFDRMLPLMHQRHEMLIDGQDPDEISMFMDMVHRLEEQVDRALEDIEVAGDGAAG